MDAQLEKYLHVVNKYLKPLPTSERVDIVKEVRVSMLEMEGDNLSTEQILDRLGKPQDLAKAYLGDLLSAQRGMSWKKVLIVCAFYSVVGFSGMVIIPSLAIIAPVCMVAGVAGPLTVALKMIDRLLNLGIPNMRNIGVLTDLLELNPFVEFAMAVAIGGLLFLIGYGCWKLLVMYCKKVSKTKAHLSLS